MQTKFKSFIKIILLFLLVLVISTVTLIGYNNVQMVDFKNLSLPNKPNHFLVCPADYCNVKANETITPYPVSVTELQSAWQQLVAAQPKTELVNSLPLKNQYQYVQRSKFFGFPDYIDVQFIPLTDNSSTLAIYSRARFGYSDFHVNQQRVKNWLTLLPNYFATKSKQ